MRFLKIEKSQITDEGLDYLKHSDHLIDLEFTDVPISGTGLKLLSQLQLQSLSISGLQNAGPALVHLKMLRNLKSLNLDLSESNFTDSEAVLLKGMKALAHLNLNGTDIGDSGLVHLTNETRLFELKFVSTRVTDAGLKHVSQLPGLRFLDLSQTRVSDAGVELLSQLSELDALQLAGSQMTETGLKQLSVALPDTCITQK